VATRGSCFFLGVFSARLFKQRHPRMEFVKQNSFPPFMFIAIERAGGSADKGTGKASFPGMKGSILGTR